MGDIRINMKRFCYKIALEEHGRNILSIPKEREKQQKLVSTHASAYKIS